MVEIIKYKLPDRFHERVLELEIQIEWQKEHVHHDILKQFTSLYSVIPLSLLTLQEAIEYYGYMDEIETCMDLNMRMQSILVKQHVLEALNTHEQLNNEEEESEEDSSDDDDVNDRVDQLQFDEPV